MTRTVELWGVGQPLRRDDGAGVFVASRLARRPTEGFRVRVCETVPDNFLCRLRIDPLRHSVSWKGKDVSLTVTEFLILETLASRPGIVRSRNQLMDAAYQDDVYIDDRTIDSHIKRLRRKFREVDPEFDAIATLYGAGYRFSDDG